MGATPAHVLQCRSAATNCRSAATNAATVAMNRRNQRSHRREFVDFYHYNRPDSDSEDLEDLQIPEPPLEEFEDLIQVRPIQDFQIRNAQDRQYYDSQDRLNQVFLRPKRPYRRRILVPKSVQKCPLYNAKKPENEEDEATKFRRFYLENLDVYEDYDRETVRFDNDLACDIFEKYLGKLRRELCVLDGLNLSNETEFATIGPSGCLEYLRKLQNGEINKTQTTGFFGFCQNSPKIMNFPLFQTPNMPRFNSRHAHFLCSPQLMVFCAQRRVSTAGRISEYLDVYFNSAQRTEESFEFAGPGASFYLILHEEGDIEIVENAKMSPYAILEISESQRGILTPAEYCARQFGANSGIEKIEKLSYVQRLFFSKNRKNPLKIDTFLIKFDSFEAKNLAFQRSFDKIGLKIEEPEEIFGIFDETMEQNSYEMVTIEVRFDTMKTNRKSARLRLRSSRDVEFARRILSDFGMMVELPRRVVENGGRMGNRELSISHLPEFLDTVDHLQWFIDQYLAPNDIYYEFIRFDTVQVQDLDERSDFWNRSKLRDPAQLFARNLIEMACRRNLWKGEFIRNDADLDRIAQDSTKHPFIIEEFDEYGMGENGERKLLAKFYGKNVALGKRLAEDCYTVSQKFTHFMQFKQPRFHPARISASYRKLVPRTRRVRVACAEGVRRFDEKLRYLWADYEEQNKERPEGIEMNFLRVLDMNMEDQETVDETWGMCGIEGWPVRVVEEELKEMSKIFEPVEFSCDGVNSDLLYGRGEAFVKHLISKMRDEIVVDFDRFNQKLWIFGDKTSQFIEELNEFRTEHLFIHAKIPFSAPVFNENMRQIVRKRVLKSLEIDLGAKISVNSMEKCVEYDGPFVSFKIFADLMAKINRDIFTKLTQQLPPSINSPNCPVCRTPAGPDFYRLDACGHTYCRECLNNLVKNQGKHCLVDTCTKHICPQDFRLLILGSEVSREKSLDSLKIREFFKNSMDEIVKKPGSKFKFCKKPDCQGLVQCAQNDWQEGPSTSTATVPPPSTVICQDCDTVYCANCLEEPHPEVEDCEEYGRLKQDVELSLEKFARSNKNRMFKRCPTSACKAVIEKADGCNHVECPFCHTHFCWLCLFKSDSMGQIYSHMSLKHGGHGGNGEPAFELFMDEPAPDRNDFVFVNNNNHNVAARFFEPLDWDLEDDDDDSDIAENFEFYEWLRFDGQFATAEEIRHAFEYGIPPHPPPAW
ncbi:unnamed protein product [Caenorhabditis angaria]|uniref:RBR-type E3 ubiquitin transferase n=1 Tax=Caenorhabditis angaria TaxID=860376 RepID=A0A9P1MVB3_9PELO|nr:unnamed protein product [Caenorhabditis angaria]